MTTFDAGKMFAFDLETTGTNPHECRIVTSALVRIDGVQYYVRVMELNLDSKGQAQPEQTIAKSARPSVLDRLKALPIHGSPEKPRKKEMEAR